MATERLSKEESIARIMKGLHCDRSEAEDVYNYDKKIDRDEKTEFDLTPEQQKVARTFTKTGTRKTPTTYNWSKRERKENLTKAELIAKLADFLSDKVDDMNITNKERQIAFNFNNESYELTLVQKRKKKQ